jgi:aspartate/methionine/tyrosine aminotransferase
MGWGVGPEELVWECWRINNVLGVHPPDIPDHIALELFENGGLERIGAWARNRARQNLEQVERFIQEHPRLSWVKPDGGIIAWVRLNDADDATPFIRLLHDKYSTAIIPGSHFGVSNGFRLGFGIASTDLAEGLRRMDLALAEMTT